MWGKQEELILNRDVRLEGRILNYLTGTQIEGVRFVFRNYIKGKGSILSGPRRHLFNEWIIFSLIYALATVTEEKSNKKCRKCVIITKTEGKKLVWERFFHNFLPDVCNFQLYCVTFRELSEISTKFGREKPQLIVFDEANELDKELDSKITKNISSKVPIVFTCDSSTPIIDDLQFFHKLVTYCGQELCFTDPFDFINNFCKRQNRGKLRDFIRDFYLEHFWHEVKSETVPYETREVNQTVFEEQSYTETSQSQSDSEIFKCDTVRFIPEKEIKVAKVISAEDFTCNMAPLEYNSKSSSSQEIYNADTQPYEVKENTPRSVYGQEINSDNVLFEFEPLPDDVPIKRDKNITEDLFIDMSVDLEEVKAPTEEVIVISSGSTVAQTTKTTERCTSPDDLFSDDDDEVILAPRRVLPLLDSPHPSSLPVLKALERCNTKMSTPIAQLINAPLDSQSPIGFLSPNFWNETKPVKIPEESVFEITKNDVFGNVMRINEHNEISPVGQKPKTTEKYDWSAFTETSPVKESPKKTLPEPISPTRSVDTPEKSNSSSQLHTPTSKRMTTPCSSRSSSKRIFKSGGGWLNKYSPVVAPKTPKTPKNRRKKLETLFNDVAPKSATGADLLLSPNDLFE